MQVDVMDMLLVSILFHPPPMVVDFAKCLREIYCPLPTVTVLYPSPTICPRFQMCALPARDVGLLH